MVTWTIPEDTINLDAQVVITWPVFSSAICYLSSQNTKLLMYYQNLFSFDLSCVLCTGVVCQSQMSEKADTRHNVI